MTKVKLKIKQVENLKLGWEDFLFSICRKVLTHNLSYSCYGKSSNFEMYKDFTQKL